MNKNIIVEVANSSSLLDTAVPNEEKLYGYHRLADPKMILADENNKLRVFNKSQVEKGQKQEQKSVLIDRNDSHLEPKIGEPKKW